MLQFVSVLLLEEGQTSLLSPRKQQHLLVPSGGERLGPGQGDQPWGHGDPDLSHPGGVMPSVRGSD